MTPDPATLASTIETAVQSFRTGMDAAGSRALEQLTGLLAQAAEAAADPGFLARLLPLLEQALAAQERGDTLYLADLLEYELPSLLAGADIPGFTGNLWPKSQARRDPDDNGFRQ